MHQREYLNAVQDAQMSVAALLRDLLQGRYNHECDYLHTNHDDILKLTLQLADLVMELERMAPDADAIDERRSPEVSAPIFV